jgi:hypothetical protein
MLTKEDLTRWIQSEIIGWQAEAERSPRTHKTPGVLAYRLAERIEVLLLGAKEDGFLVGACAARERPDESVEELQSSFAVQKNARELGEPSRFEELEQ